MEVVSNVKIFGLEDSVRASKYPKSVDVSKTTTEVTDTVENLGMCAGGTGHCNFLVGVVVQFDLSFTIKAWTEAERYHFFDIISSQSTMHRISKMDIAKSCIEYVSPEIIEVVERLVCQYNKTENKEDYLKLLYNVPVGLRLTARMTTNYLQLKTIYKQRRGHRLPEWQSFCDWCETLPHSNWITGKVQMSEEEKIEQAIARG